MLRATSVMVVLLASTACATGIGTGVGEDDVTEVGGGDGIGGNDPGMSGGMGGNPTGMPGTGGTGGNPTGMPGTGGMGGDSGPMCGPQEHLCGGICTGNTPNTGCYQSVDCTACPNVPNGTATCDANGQCAAMCNSPYVPSGSTCICPTQCCTNADCGNNASCQNGSCVQDPSCDQAACIAICLIQQKVGVCISDVCTCIN